MHWDNERGCNIVGEAALSVWDTYIEKKARIPFCLSLLILIVEISA
jgi:hypothetical protein